MFAVLAIAVVFLALSASVAIVTATTMTRLNRDLVQRTAELGEAQNQCHKEHQQWLQVDSARIEQKSIIDNQAQRIIQLCELRDALRQQIDELNDSLAAYQERVEKLEGENVADDENLDDYGDEDRYLDASYEDTCERRCNY